jgi:hypothetical protein
MTSERPTAADQCLSMQERVDSSRVVLNRQADNRATSDEVLANSRDHLVEMHRRAAQDGTP